MLRQVRLIKAILCTAMAAAAPAVLAAPPIQFTSFDIPGAAGYFVSGINDDGTVVGNWTPISAPPPYVSIGFIRDSSGHIRTPVLDPNDTESFTALEAINEKGIIAGFYGLSVARGFLLDEDLFVPVDFPGAADTAVRGINNRGDL